MLVYSLLFIFTYVVKVYFIDNCRNYWRKEKGTNRFFNWCINHSEVSLLKFSKLYFYLGTFSVCSLSSSSSSSCQFFNMNYSMLFPLSISNVSFVKLSYLVYCFQIMWFRCTHTASTSLKHLWVFWSQVDSLTTRALFQKVQTLSLLKLK